MPAVKTRRSTRVTSKRITKGVRKGKTIKVYASSGTEVRAKGQGKVGTMQKRPRSVAKAIQTQVSKRGPGPVGGTLRSRRAKLAKKFVKGPAKAKPSKTSSHVKAGLHRVGKSGNRYVDRSGSVLHRVGKGKASRFVKGEPPKSKKAKAKKAPAKKAPVKGKKAKIKKVPRAKGRKAKVQRVKRR